MDEEYIKVDSLAEAAFLVALKGESVVFDLSHLTAKQIVDEDLNHIPNNIYYNLRIYHGGAVCGLLLFLVTQSSIRQLYG